MGDFPEYELSVQAVDEKQAAKLDFDILDATKIIPEEVVPLRPLGKMVLNRMPDNFFAETEQVAFSPRIWSLESISAKTRYCRGDYFLI